MNNGVIRKKKCLFIFTGHAFRHGGQFTHNIINEITHKDVYDEQIEALHSHIRLFQFLKEKYGYDVVDISISSYHSEHDNTILSIYDKEQQQNIIHSRFLNELVGQTANFYDGLSQVIFDEEYEFIMFLRLDLLLKQDFFDVFNPDKIKKITFPFVCWKRDCMVDGFPRVADTMIFIPNKYISFFKKMRINIGHNAWKDACKSGLSYSDMDVFLKTLHDSDSEKDFNPLYRICGRKETKIWNSPNCLFIYDKVFDYSSSVVKFRNI